MKMLLVATMFFLALIIVSCHNSAFEPLEEVLESPDFSTTPYQLSIPTNMPNMPIPFDNPLTEEGVALGKKLFFDPILSGNNLQSCSSCHRQNFAFVDSSLALSIGIDGLAGTRNSMPLFNVGWNNNKGYFWDGGAVDLENQVIGPIENPLEMHEDLTNAIEELQADENYPSLFYAAFGTDSITTSKLMKAIAQFERTIISANSRYDKWERNEAGGYLSEQELRGKELFVAIDKGDCNHCHVLGSLFTDLDYRNTGLDSIPIDFGRYLITLKEFDKGKMKTPTLRNIELTAPYMHDGRFTSLVEVLNFYNTGFYYTENLDVNIAEAVKGRMTDEDMEAIIAFLKTLTDYELITNNTFFNN